jgi:hypothetical protein
MTMSASSRALSPRHDSTPHARPAAARLLAAALTAAALSLAGACSGGTADQEEGASSSGETTTQTAPDTPTADTHEADTHDAEASTSDASETPAATSRIAITYDGGIQVRDATTLELVADIAMPGFLRVNSAGDGRHVFVTVAETGFQLLDLGVWTVAHGDHGHYYAAPPVLTDTLFPAQAPGHVVPHDGRTILFDDATGHVVVVDAAELTEGLGAIAREHTTPTPHHGVAVELPDGTLVVSEGTSEGRTGIRVLDAAGTEIAASDECPGLHGEAVSADEAVTFGCADGVIIYRDGAIAKAPAPEPVGATSTMSGTEGSPVALGNYRLDDADPAPAPRVALVNTVTGTETTVELPSGYGSWSFARLEDGTGLVLGTDGALHVIDTAAGAVTASHPVLDAWTVPENWQDPSPKVMVLGDMAYVLDAAGSRLLVVDPVTGDIWKQTDLGIVPGEIAGVDGSGPATHDHDHDHEGEGEEHDEEEGHDE